MDGPPADGGTHWSVKGTLADCPPTVTWSLWLGPCLSLVRPLCGLVGGRWSIQ